jgi:hypothetical protein
MALGGGEEFAQSVRANLSPENQARFDTLLELDTTIDPNKQDELRNKLDATYPKQEAASTEPARKRSSASF